MARLPRVKKEDFNAWMKNQATARGITMHDLGRSADISSPRLSDLSYGKTAPDTCTDKIRSLARATGTSYGKVLRLACEARRAHLLEELRILKSFVQDRLEKK